MTRRCAKTPEKPFRAFILQYNLYAVEDAFV